MKENGKKLDSAIEGHDGIRRQGNFAQLLIGALAGDQDPVDIRGPSGPEGGPVDGKRLGGCFYEQLVTSLVFVWTRQGRAGRPLSRLRHARLSCPSSAWSIRIPHALVLSVFLAIFFPLVLFPDGLQIHSGSALY